MAFVSFPFHIVFQVTENVWFSWQEDLIAADEEEYNRGDVEPFDYEDDEAPSNEGDVDVSHENYNGDVDLANINEGAEFEDS